ncbi:hypothetical protein, partial [Synechococcus sp. MIT S9509]|uniref:hypothetical protein n=1 Tax=Synechococcus sp. MIT S9509 TaxID=1801630 RepID=UPI0018D4019A
ESCRSETTGDLEPESSATNGFTHGGEEANPVCPTPTDRGEDRLRRVAVLTREERRQRERAELEAWINSA